MPKEAKNSGGHKQVVDSEQIRSRLNNILESDAFSRSPRMSQFLRFVVEEELAGRGGRLNGTQIAIDVYGRDAGFDPRTDPVVRTEASRLRRALERYYLTDGKLAAVRIDIPKGGYRPLFEVVSEVDSEKGETASTSSETGVAGNTNDTSKEGFPVIAVLPFRNLGGKGEDYFAEGFAGALITALTRFNLIRVIALQSTIHYQGQPVDVRQVGRELGARFVLTGDIRRGKKNIRVRAAFSDAQDGTQLWSEIYDRPLQAENLFELEEELTRLVLAQVAHVQGAIPKATGTAEVREKSAQELSTYEAGLRFIAYLSQFRREDFFSARGALAEAVKREPNWALGWSGLAILDFYDYTGGITGKEGLPRIIQKHANQGAALAPGGTTAHIAQAVAAFVARKPERVIEESETAIRLNPYAAFGISYAGYLIAHAGGFERGIAILKETEKLNPCMPSWLLGVRCLYHYLRSEYDAALAIAERFTLDEWIGKPFCLAITLAQLGRTEEANDQLKLLKQLHPVFAADPEALIRRNFLFDDQIEKVMDSLRKAGL